MGGKTTADQIVINQPSGGYNDIGSLVNNIVTMAMIIAAILVFLYLVWGGIQWITSGGDKAGVEAARNRITSALIGLAIIAAAYAIILVLQTFFHITIIGGFNIPTPAP